MDISNKPTLNYEITFTVINNGVKSPKVLLMSRHGSSGEEASQDLVFN
ncbi:MAG: hypothetical protein WC623_11955 [Pedobacter sp.]